MVVATITSKPRLSRREAVCTGSSLPGYYPATKCPLCAGRLLSCRRLFSVEWQSGNAGDLYSPVISDAFQPGKFLIDLRQAAPPGAARRRVTSVGIAL
jgi:hypothetical protein